MIDTIGINRMKFSIADLGLERNTKKEAPAQASKLVYKSTQLRDSRVNPSMNRYVSTIVSTSLSTILSA